jgi:hypothetical protein
MKFASKLENYNHYHKAKYIFTSQEELEDTKGLTRIRK